MYVHTLLICISFYSKQLNKLLIHLIQLLQLILPHFDCSEVMMSGSVPTWGSCRRVLRKSSKLMDLSRILSHTSSKSSRLRSIPGLVREIAARYTDSEINFLIQSFSASTSGGEMAQESGSVNFRSSLEANWVDSPPTDCGLPGLRCSIKDTKFKLLGVK